MGNKGLFPKGALPRAKKRPGTDIKNTSLPDKKSPNQISNGGPRLHKNNNGNSNGNGNGNGNGNNRYGEYAGYKGVKRKRAARLVDSDLKDLMQMLRRELRRGRRDARHQMGDVRDEYGNMVEDINQTFGETGEFIGQQNGIIDQRFADANTQAQAAQAALMQQLGALNGGNTGAVDGELARLGMDSGQFTGQMGADQAYATDMASIMGANNSANLAAMQASSGSIGELLLGMNEGTKGSMLSGAMRDKSSQIKDIRQGQRDFTKDVRQQMLDMKSQRGDMIREMLEQLAQTGWAQYVDQQSLNQSQQQINMQRQQMQHGFAMDRASSSGYGSSGSSSGYGMPSSGSAYDAFMNPEQGDPNAQPGKKPKKPKYNVWGGQLPGNYPGDSSGYLP